MYTLQYDRFLDKVHGCWYGKCLGGAAGAPCEGIKKLIDIEDFSSIYDPDLPNDDLDIQLLWIDVLKEKGFNINSCDLADAWILKCWYPFSEYGYFMKNYERGVKPPYSGVINNSFFKEGMGCPIRSEIWGIVCAGNPELAAYYAYMDGTLDHADNSVYAEQFLAAAEAIAFVCDDINEVIKRAMEFIPKEAKLRKCFDMILDMYNKGIDWHEVRTEALNKFGHPDFTNVVQNLSFVLISLLYGECDMRKTINISLQCGYDTDCTCASAASIVGIIKGYKALGELGSMINDYFVCGVDVVLESDSIYDLSKETVRLAMKAPNKELVIENAPFTVEKESFTLAPLEKVTEEGLAAEMKKLKPITWTVYGPFYEQLDLPSNPNYPSPHAPGSVLPDIVCMVNNQAFLDQEYVDESKDFDILPRGKIDAYEDFVEIDKVIRMEGQMCCYAEAEILSDEDKKAWIIIGNNDAFKVWVNGEEVIKKDECRLWTPYNNFELIDLKKGKNKIVLKLLRRGENLKFSIGLRQYTGNHWHRSKWITKY